ncbi:MAG: D-alanyl-D-alanine carboxypeptidase family protein [Lachnospiraceae bacterium]|nr:D-alanyl-D-alanine carboxypeptidase family protein [Lachnospiraceae bacterium]MDE7202632.1 D-alanyl-D-alanine carboxypeptidase family protein [Lachnospiraceae bacterium]
MKTILLKNKDIYKGYLLLVNKEYRYHEQHQELSHTGVWNGEEILYESRANHALNKLMEEIGGWEYIVPVSAWRSSEEQQEIWDQSMAESGQEFTEKYVAVPGHSEHQTGLAIDLGLKQEEIDFIRPYFPYEGICQTFRQRAAEYGFVQRYQEEKQAVTQIGHEPWHFRYVGVPHAEIMAQKGFALEEYIAFLKEYRFGENPFIFQKYKISYVKAAVKATVKAATKTAGAVTGISIDDTRPYSISGNNCDGFIVTEVFEKTEEDLRLDYSADCLTASERIGKEDRDEG